MAKFLRVLLDHVDQCMSLELHDIDCGLFIDSKEINDSSLR